MRVTILKVLTYRLLCMEVIGSQALRLILNLSPLDIHIVPSLPGMKRHPSNALVFIVCFLPPMQYRCPSKAATPQLLLLEDIDGTGDQLPTLGSNLKRCSLIRNNLIVSSNVPFNRGLVICGIESS